MIYRIKVIAHTHSISNKPGIIKSMTLGILNEEVKNIETIELGDRYFRFLCYKYNYVYITFAPYSTLTKYNLHIHLPYIDNVNIKSDCKGCYCNQNKVLSCEFPFECNDKICPCYTCLVKGMCKDICDELWKYYIHCLRFKKVHMPYSDDIILRSMNYNS